MTIQEAIKKANENGYNGYPMPFCMECGGYESPNKNRGGSIFLDSQFWQCLGKGMGWDDKQKCKKGYITYFEATEKQEHYWKYQWHLLIDHLAEGKTIESYFESL
jgi:hypothetical protein